MINNCTVLVENMEVDHVCGAVKTHKKLPHQFDKLPYSIMFGNDIVNNTNGTGSITYTAPLCLNLRTDT